MSLQVWLPLNGNLDNQGLLDINSSLYSGTSFNSSGKIGQCLVSGGTSQTQYGINVTSTNLCSELGTEYSVAVWVNPFGNHCHYNGTIISSGNWNNSCWAFGVSQDNTKVDVFCKGYNIYVTLPSPIPINAWTHIASTQKNGVCKVYINGVYVGQTTDVNRAALASDASNFSIGRETYADGYFGFNGKINDVRIYDHCLSPKEVKEISKGLVLHYPLNDPYVEGTTNINSYVEQGIDETCFNGATQKYGYGTNTDMYKVMGNFQGKQCTKVYMGTANQDAWAYVHFTNMHPSNGEYKTISFDYYPTSQTKINFYTHGGVATLTSRVNGIIVNNGTMTVNLNQWNHISVTLFGTSDSTSGWGYMRIGTAKYTSTTTDYWLFANVQIEINDHETPYTASSSNAETTVYDCSGFNYNGTVSSGGLVCTVNSPRYDKCYYFNSTSQYISTPTIDTSGFANTYTFSWWGKVPSYSSVMFWGFSNGNRLNYYSGLYCNTGDGSSNPFYSSGTTTISTPSTNTWHHFAMVGDGSSTQLYVDGVLYGTAKAYRSLTGTKIYINGWDSGTSYKTNGYISDFRLYSTALSATDIKELYNAPISITNNGALMTQGEVIE